MERIDLAPFLHPQRIITLAARTRTEAIEELARALTKTTAGLDLDQLVRAVWERERAGSTRISDTVAMPHARVPCLAEPCVIAVGRSPRGIEYEDGNEHPVRLVTLMVVRAEAPKLFLEVLGSMAQVVCDPAAQQMIINTADTAAVIDCFRSRTAPAAFEEGDDRGRVTRSVLRAAARLAEEQKARAIVVCNDAFDDACWHDEVPRDCRLIVAGRRLGIIKAIDHPDVHPVPISFGGDYRTRQIPLVLLFCLSRDLLAPTDTVVCVSGIPGSGCCDTVVVTEVQRECKALNHADPADLASDIRPDVLERTVQLACEIAAEGREGHPLGALFVVGDSDAVLPLTKQLVMNPFHGYPEEVRNILDPTLAETIKEFAAIDGAFLVRGDGVVLAAGAYLRPAAAPADLPAGYGARHQAAASITAATRAYAIAVSASTGFVSLFKHGKILTTIEKGRR